MTGIETEFHLIDTEGRISPRASEVIHALRKRHPDIRVVPEIGKNMIEFNSYPDVYPDNPALDLMRSLELASQVCEEKGVMMYPFGTYPGRFKPEFTDKPVYALKKKIFGPARSEILCRTAGFHHHYTLPKGVFDSRKKEVRLMKKSKLERTMISSYNLEIAADPVLTLLTQSSPFYQGKNFAKDTRVIAYRGGKKLRYMEGAYANLQQMGGLPPYKQTATDLFISLRKRWKRWEDEVSKADPDADFGRLYPYKLDIGWHPVKINKHGTLEQRGMDVNFVSTVLGVTVLLKYCLKEIHREFIEVIPADFGVDEAFKIEKNIMYIPPHTYVRDKFQPWSAYLGFGQDEMYRYAKRFFNMAKTLTPKRYSRVLRPIQDMIDQKRSMSDEILRYATYKGYIDNKEISDDDARELALFYAKKFPKDIEKTKESLLRVARV